MDPSEYTRPGSKWDLMMSLFLDQEDVLTGELRLYKHELDTIRLLTLSPVVETTFIKWIDSLEYPEKHSLTSSLEYRRLGNELFDNGTESCSEAIKLYNKAIFCAPEDSTELALAHANRSAALLKLCYFEESYRDASHALQLKNPKPNELKLRLRMASCAAALNNKTKLQEHLIFGVNLIKKLKQTNKKATMKIEELKKKLERMNDNKPKSPERDPLPPKPTTPKKIIEKESSDKGRYIVAGEDIKKDDFIMEEDAFSFVPVKDTFNEDVDNDCQNCARTNIFPFPCYKCVGASYCSIECKNQHEPIHQFECEGYRRGLFGEIGIAHLALRTFLMGYKEAFAVLERVKKKRKCIEIWNILMTTVDDNKTFEYGKVLRLVTNFDKMCIKDYLRYALTAVMLVTYLKKYTQFFTILSKEALDVFEQQSDVELIIGGLLLRHLGQLVCNGHGITGFKTITEDGAIMRKDTVKLGALHLFIRCTRVFTGLYPRVSMLNHSCEPNIRVKFDKKRLTVYADQDIKQGEEIFNCYGPHYKLLRTSNRLKMLKKQYCFDCTCKWCINSEESDRIYDELESYYCPTDGCDGYAVVAEEYKYWYCVDGNLDLTCEMCRKPYTFHWMKHFNDVANQIEQNCVYDDVTRKDETCAKLMRIYEDSIAYLAPQHEIRKYMGQLILSQYVSCKGDLSIPFNTKMVNMAKEWLKSIENRYGCSSPEYVKSVTYLIDLIALRRKMSTRQPIAIDMDKVNQAISIVPDFIRPGFDTYLKNFIL